jgi:hypothetical protein
LGLFLHGQGVPNPSFELWSSDTLDAPVGWFNSNLWSKMVFGSPNVTKSIDKHGGQYAVRMETKIGGGDTIFGFVANTPSDPGSGEGGVPYSQQPTILRGWAKYDLMPNDTAIIFVAFKDSGFMLSADFYYLTGTSNTYTYFEMPLTLNATPDSVIIAAASSWPDGQFITNGSWLILDDLSFNTSDPIPNGDFENWNTSVRTEPVEWASFDFLGDTSEIVTRTTDAITGQYAVRIETKALSSFQDTVGYLTSGALFGSSQGNGQPFANSIDTLCGYYKYSGIGNDSATINVIFYANGASIDVAAKSLGDEANYTYFEIPFQLTSTPDTVKIDIWSSIPTGSPMPGSVLILDSLRFKSDPLVGIASTDSKPIWQLFPNPTSGVAWLQAAVKVPGTYELEIVSLTGKVVHTTEIEMFPGLNNTKIDLNALSSGVYIVRMQGRGYLGSMKLMVE